MQNISVSPLLFFALGLCVPSSCEADDLGLFVNVYLQAHPDLTAFAFETTCQERHIPLTTKAKFVISICSIFIALLVMGTFYDVAYKRWWLAEKRRQSTSSSEDQNGQVASSSNSANGSHGAENQPIIDPQLQRTKLYSDNKAVDKEKPSSFYDIGDKVLMSFSVYTNTANLFTIEQSEESIDCIHGMRFISMTWVILLHTYSSVSVGLENMFPFMKDSSMEWTFMPIIKSINAVDTFFATSGLLLTIVVLKKLTKEAVTPKFFAVFYSHRFFRITPPYMLIMMTYIPLFKYLAKGPFWPQDGFEDDECEDTWWTNLLYLNNFIKTENTCMSWTWYLACDVQFYLVSPLMFIPLFYYGWKGLLAPFAFLLATATYSGVITNVKSLLAVVGPYLVAIEPGKNNYDKYVDYWKYYYIKPFTRIGPFVVGIMAGFLLYKTECKARISKVLVVLGWLAAAAMALAVQYGLHDHVRYEDRNSTDVRALYNALQNIAWGVSVCWVIFACASGYGGFVNTFLSWKAFIPLSRLTYCAYLVHPLVVRYFFYYQRKPFYVNNPNMSFVFVAVVALSYAIAYIAYMAYEIPMVGLEKAIRGFKRRR